MTLDNDISSYELWRIELITFDFIDLNVKNGFAADRDKYCMTTILSCQEYVNIMSCYPPVMLIPVPLVSGLVVLDNWLWPASCINVLFSVWYHSGSGSGHIHSYDNYINLPSVLILQLLECVQMKTSGIFFQIIESIAYNQNLTLMLSII